jgi:Tfp pilus assembly protein PilO
VTRRLAVVSVIIAVVMVAAFYVAAWRPQSHHLSQANKALTAAQTKTQQLQSQVATLRGEQKLLPKYQQQLAALTAALPKTPALDQAVDQLNAVSQLSGVSIPAIANTAATSTSATTPGASQGPSSVTVTVSVDGTYPQIRAFIGLLSQTPRLFVVDAINLGGGSGGGSANGLNSPGAIMTAQVTMGMFYTGAPVNTSS